VLYQPVIFQIYSLFLVSGGGATEYNLMDSNDYISEESISGIVGEVMKMYL
jgi:hypothetical protein